MSHGCTGHALQQEAGGGWIGSRGVAVEDMKDGEEGEACDRRE